MNEEKLFKRLIARFHSTKIAQKLTSLAVASSLALSISGCTEALPEAPTTENQTNINNSYQNTDENINNEKDPNNNQNNDQNNNFEEIEASGYSEILKLVLNDPYYRSLTNSLYGQNDVNTIFKTNKFNPIPYAFLEDEGFDVEEIINKNLSCISVSYVKDDAPNDLYMVFSVETKGVTPYYTQYILKYTLTDQEMKDYKWVHKEKCAQAPLMNQAIGELKTPEVISKNKITVEAYENLLEFSKNRSVIKNLLGGKRCVNFVIKEIGNDKTSFVVHAYPVLSSSNMITSSVLVADATWSKCFYNVELNSDGAMIRPLGYNDFDIYSENNQHSGEKATFYNPQDIDVRHITMENLLEQ